MRNFSIWGLSALCLAYTIFKWKRPQISSCVFTLFCLLTVLTPSTVRWRNLSLHFIWQCNASAQTSIKKNKSHNFFWCMEFGMFDACLGKLPNNVRYFIWLQSNRSDFNVILFRIKLLLVLRCCRLVTLVTAFCGNNFAPFSAVQKTNESL